MQIIDGKKISEEILENLKQEIVKNKLTPGLAIIMIGEDPASHIYIKNKIKACEEIGIKGTLYQFNEFSSESDIIDTILKLNNDNAIDGIIVQSPLPANFDEDKIMNTITQSKDVDGFGVSNLGYLTTNKELFVAATPKGIIKLLEKENINLASKHVVIIGRSKIVGRPLALALLNRDATVTITHSKTKNLKEITKLADILVVAIGVPNFITSDYLKEGAIVIDVGINRIDGKIYGDVDFESVKNKVSYITPVPGGVGPMTVAMLLSNVVESAKKKESGNKDG